MLNIWHNKGSGQNTVTIEIEKNPENQHFPTLQNIVIWLNEIDRV